MSITRASGTEFSGSDVFATFGTTTIRCIKASYGDKMEKGDVQEMGTQFILAVTAGTYKPEEGKITMRNSVWRTEFLPLVPRMGGSNVPGSVVISYNNPDIGTDSDLWRPCYYVGSSISPDNSNKSVDVDLTFKVQQYYWGDQRTTKNAIAGGLHLGLSRL